MAIEKRIAVARSGAKGSVLKLRDVEGHKEEYEGGEGVGIRMPN